MDQGRPCCPRAVASDGARFRLGPGAAAGPRGKAGLAGATKVLLLCIRTGTRRQLLQLAVDAGWCSRYHCNTKSCVELCRVPLGARSCLYFVVAWPLPYALPHRCSRIVLVGVERASCSRNIKMTKSQLERSALTCSWLTTPLRPTATHRCLQSGHHADDLG